MRERIGDARAIGPRAFGADGDLGYNTAGQVTSVTDPLQHTTTFEYTGPDVTKITDPLGRITQRFVDAAGRVLSQADPSGQITRLEYNKLSQLTRVTDPLGGVTNYGYDTAGRLGTVTDARTNHTTYGYDLFNRLGSRTDPVSKTETFAYDVAGNPSQGVDRKGQVTTRTYDALNRLHKVTFADTSTITYTYDSGNRLTTIADSVNGNITRIYDNLDRLTSETTAQGTVNYTYDTADRRATMTVTDQPTVTYGYNDANRLTSVAQGASTVTLTYDDANRRSTLTLPNGIVVTYGYNNANELTSLAYALGQTTFGTLTYTYDLAGRRTEVGGTWARTGLPAAVSSGNYDAANRLTQWAGNLFSYDTNGNVASDGLTTYTFSARDMLVGIDGSASASFVYDGLGRRAHKTISGATTSFLYDGANALQEIVGGVPVANRLVSLDVDEAFVRTDGNGSFSTLSDAQDSAIAQTDSSGAIVRQAEYEPFGRTSLSGGPTANSFLYTGGEWDADTGLYDYRARYYNPLVARFVSEDPEGLKGGGNYYRYVSDNPTNLTDPTGLFQLKGFPPAQAAQMTTAIGQLAARLRAQPCCIDPRLRDRVIDLLKPGSGDSGMTFVYRKTLASDDPGFITCAQVSGWDFITNRIEISDAAMNGTCGCPLAGTILHELVHQMWGNRLGSSPETPAYGAAAACFGPKCAKPVGLGKP